MKMISVCRKLYLKPSYVLEILIRIFFIFIFRQLDITKPFIRTIHPDELWHYKYPTMTSYVTTHHLWFLIFVVPVIIILVTFLTHREASDITQALLGVSLAIGLTGVLTNLLKAVVGRPRPDFFWRCFPDGNIVGSNYLQCTGKEKVIMEGRRSFPSGHSSFAFASMGFIAWYIAGKLHVFESRGKGQSWRLCLFLLPLIVALLVSISRICDYHHHWEDATVGSLMGLGFSYLCYRHYYPSLGSVHSHLSLLSVSVLQNQDNFRIAQEPVRRVVKCI